MIFQRTVSDEGKKEMKCFHQLLRTSYNIFQLYSTDSYTEITNFVQGYIDNEVNA